MSKKMVLSLICVILVGLFLGQAVVADDSEEEPGSEDDPLITLSYVENDLKKQLKAELKDEVSEEIMEDLEEKLSDKKEADEPPDELEGSGSQEFEIVEVKANETIIGEDSSELILRAGEGTIVDSPSGGVNDLTQGTDLTQGAEAPSNHQLLIPRDDGRGIAVTHDAVLMVRGGYYIE